jgi:hypothetical protein
MSYLVIDAADDAILAECESAMDVLPILEQVRQERPQRKVFVMRLGEHRGELVSTRSLVTVRPLSDTEGFAVYRR